MVKGVSFQLHEGEFLSILGTSGCGKTTLLRMLIGILEPTAGQILLDGKDITNAHPSARIMVMHNGGIEQLDTPENLIAHPSTPFVKQFVADNMQMKIDALIQYRRG